MYCSGEPQFVHQGNACLCSRVFSLRVPVSSSALRLQIAKMVVASAVNDEGDQIYPRKWNHEFIDLPQVTDQRTPTFTAEEVAKITKAAEGQLRVLYSLLGGTGLEAWRWSECVGLLEEVPLPAHWLSLDFLVRTLLLFIGYESLPRSSISRRLACSCRGRRNLRRFLGRRECRALDVLRLSALKLDVREAHPRHEVPALEITVHLFKAADLACHHERPDLAFEVIALRFARLWEFSARPALA